MSLSEPKTSVHSSKGRFGEGFQMNLWEKET